MKAALTLDVQSKEDDGTGAPAPAEPSSAEVAAALADLLADITKHGREFSWRVVSTAPDTAGPARIAALEKLAGDLLDAFHASGDGHRARAGQVQIARWRSVLEGSH